MNEIAAAQSALQAWKSIVGTASPEPLRQVTNPLWRVVTEAGREFVLKLLPEFAPGMSPVEAFRVVSHLHGAGVPVVPPIVTDDASIHTSVDERQYVLLPLVPTDVGNHELGPNAATTSRAIGAAIAQLHRAFLDCPWPASSYTEDPAPQILGERLPLLSAEATRPVAPLVDRLWAAVADLPVQLTHGDCNTGNVLVHGTQVSAFIDIDHVPIGPRVRDLSYYLASRFNEHLGRSETAERDAAATVAVLGNYVAGYQQVFPLSERELGALVPLILLVEIGGAHWWLHGWVPQPERYQQGVGVITWIVEHLDGLATAAGTPPLPRPGS